MFEKIELPWRGETYTVKATDVFKLVAIIERKTNLLELSDPTRIAYSRLAEAYADAINFAGGKATGEEVYCDLFGGEDGMFSVQTVIFKLQSALVPPAAIQRAEREIAAGNNTPKKPQARAKKSA